MTDAQAYVGNLHPPTTDRQTEVSPAPFVAKLQKLAMVLVAVAFLSGVSWVIAAVLDVSWVLYVGYGLSGLLLLTMVWASLTAQVALCPYCDKTLGDGAFDNLSKGDEDHQIECGHCFEWLISDKGRVRAYTEADEAPEEHYDAPVFEGGRWPAECIVCGVPATRTEEAKKTKANLGALLVGSLSISSGSVKNIPYCDAHQDGVGLGIEDDCLRLHFPDLAMRRRYIAANSGSPLKVVKTR